MDKDNKTENTKVTAHRAIIDFLKRRKLNELNRRLVNVIVLKQQASKA